MLGWTPTLLVGSSIALHGAAAAGAAAAPAAWPWWLGAVAANHLVLGAVGMRPRSALLGPNLSRLPADAGHGCVALTFDDGPDPDVTPAVLDLLDRHGARASFFVIGARAAAYPDLVREVVRRGHGVENHTHTHPRLFACYGPGAKRRELLRAQDAITAACGRAPRYVRAPMGIRSPLLDPAMAGLPLHYTSWTRRGLDGISACPARVLRRLTDGLAAGDVLLLHDGRCARTRAGMPVVLEVLPALLEHLAARGLKAVALPGGEGGAP